MVAVQPVPPRGSFDITWLTGPAVPPRALARELVAYIPPDKPISVGELAGRVNLQIDDVELAVSSLVHDKLITPTDDGADSGQIVYVLTAVGRSLQH